MAAYVQKQLDMLQCIPIELRRKLETIRELDEQIVGLKREVVQALDEEVKSKRTKVSKTVEENLDKKLQKMRNLQNQKIEIARNLHDQLGRGSQQIERDLRSLRAQVEEEKKLGIFDNNYNTTTTKKTQQSSNDQSRCYTNNKNNNKSGGQLSNPNKKRKKSHNNNNIVDNDSILEADIYKQIDYGKVLSPQLGGLYGQPTPVGLQFQPTDIVQDEERYCVCNQISYGGMVMCDNKDCKIQWFHFECVGYTESDVDDVKWFCPQCREGQDSSKQKKS
eukprot:TRINITY_DN8273_c0_g4_i1.p1 TRINITY_DN8273_c0_g4~~TRINITY_DN8273_c0_g4_i1.p1  ORF type:complete len:277 (-),score=49.95 TRINITY_DN8273_c0_g4_i1:793-1623(-)